MRARLSAAMDLTNAAFSYDSNRDYGSYPRMSRIRPHYRALKFPSETPELCYAGGEFKLPPLLPPPESLSFSMAGLTPESKHFLDNIRKYNSCFQMTSFGATGITRDNHMPTFNIRGQVYHRVSSLLTALESEPTFLRICFMGNKEDEADQRCRFNSDTRQPIVLALQDCFHQSITNGFACSVLSIEGLPMNMLPSFTVAWGDLLGSGTELQFWCPILLQSEKKAFSLVGHSDFGALQAHSDLGPGTDRLPPPPSLRYWSFVPMKLDLNVKRTRQPPPQTTTS